MKIRGGSTQLIAALGILMAGFYGQHHADASDKLVSFEQMLPFTEMLNEVSKRRRLTVYQSNPQSVYDGVPVALVNTSRGNLAFFRDDLVELASLPIIMRRVYDSDVTGGTDFGAGGWRLSIAETVTPLSGGKYRYVDESGSEILLQGYDQALVAVHPGPTLWSTILLESSQRLRIHYRNGLTKTFEINSRGNQFLLHHAVDQYGNEIALSYDSNEQLRNVRSGGVSVSIARDTAGRISKLRADSGKEVHYGYVNGHLATVRDIGGHVWSYYYNSHSRLVEARSPAEDTDLQVEYIGNGRVASVSHNSSPVRFHYEAASHEPGIATETLVTQENGAVYRYGHDMAGRTVFGVNATGQSFWLHLNALGLVQRITVNNSPAFNIDYLPSGAPRQILEYRNDVVITHRIEYDDDENLRSISDDQSGTRVRVSTFPDGQTVEHRDLGLQLTLDNAGDLARVVTVSGASADIEYSPAGNPIVVSIDASEALRLHYSEHHRLQQIDYADGESRHYTYDGVGLRRNSSGASGTVRFTYSPTGNLVTTNRFKSEGGQTSLTHYEMDNAERLVTIKRNSELYALTYNEAGALQEIVTGSRILRFDYDMQSRFRQVSTGSDERWTYAYQPGETDIRRIADVLTSDTVIGGSMPTAIRRFHAVTRSRLRNAHFGIVDIDSISGRVHLTEGYGLLIPGMVQLQGLIKARLLRTDGTRLLSVTSDYEKKRFEAPSNILFRPPELAAVNCIFCPGLEPHSDPIGPSGTGRSDGSRDGSSPATQPLADISQQLKAVCDYGVPGSPDVPPECALEIAGMPVFLCDSQTTTLGVSGSANVNLDAVVWSSNAAIDFLPYGFAHAGPSVRILATSTGNAFVSADYLGLNRVCQDTVAAPILANEVSRYSELLDSTSCPERQQDSDLSHDIDGCSIPAITGTILGMFSPQDPVGGMPPNAATPTTFGQSELPPIFSAADLAHPLPCNFHDVCYQTCGTNRLDCDDLMLDNMLAVCATAYSACPFGSADECIAWEDDNEHCEDMADLIHRGLRLFGALAYQNRQVQYCDCCPP